MKIISDNDDFPFWEFTPIKTQPRRVGNQGNKIRKKYKDIVTAFDIETTGIDDIEQSVMYIWQWAFGDDLVRVGRTWEEFKQFIGYIVASLEKKKQWLVVYVHNLSYEFQYLRGIYPFSPDEVFAVDSRKILKCEMFNCIEFRCSYLHSNMNLATFTDKMNVKHKKLSGEEFDYGVKRYPWTPLTEKELQYCVNDVVGLVEAIETEMAFDKDNLYTIPLTSTGYVRRDAKRAMYHTPKNYVRDQLPDIDTYLMLREAFRGGNTHANRYYAGKIIKNVHSADRSSSYPDVLCNCEFPVHPFFHVGETTIENLTRMIKKRHKACIIRIALWNVRLTDEYWGCPYLSKDKCRKIADGDFDNGRILSAKYLETTITDIDFRIILAEYSFDHAEVKDLAVSTYGKLPRSLIDTTIDYYVKKTSLKNVDGQELLYMKSKNKLNSIYGMMAQDPVKDRLLFLDGEFVPEGKDPAEILFANNKRAFLCYQWGVWTTAWARFRLEEGIRLAGDGFVYCDTDSVKYVGQVSFDEYNNKRIADSKHSGAFANDPTGETHYMGVYEQEHDMCEFKTLGAKKYCYRETPDKTLQLTVAGVGKKKGAKELENAGGIEAFKEGFVFVAGGGTESIYNDNVDFDIEIDAHKIHISPNVFIKPSTYTLGITAEYMRLLEWSTLNIDK